MVHLRGQAHGNKQQPRSKKHQLHRILPATALPRHFSERRAREKHSHLLRQLFIKRHGFDVRKYSMAGFQPEVRKGFSGDAGDERRPDIQ